MANIFKNKKILFLLRILMMLSWDVEQPLLV